MLLGRYPSLTPAVKKHIHCLVKLLPDNLFPQSVWTLVYRSVDSESHYRVLLWLKSPGSDPVGSAELRWEPMDERTCPVLTAASLQIW